MNGNPKPIDTVTIPTDNGDYTAELRFIDWEQPEHRDTRGFAIPRYSLKLDTPDGESESFTAWGSIHEADEQEPGLNTTAIGILESVLNDARMFYEECDGTHQLLDRSLTVEAIRTDLAPAVDRLAEAWSIESPSEAVRVLGSVMETARQLHGIGFTYNRLHDFYQDVREVMENE